MTAAFEDYVAARGDRLLRFAFVLCGDRHLAEDLVQNVLARAYRRWSAIEADDPNAYLRTAIVHAHLSWRRRRSAGERVTDKLPEPVSGADFTQRHALRDELWTALAGLPKAQRVVLVLRYFEDLDDQHIAEVLGCARGTVRGHASRGLATLRGRTELMGDSHGAR